MMSRAFRSGLVIATVGALMAFGSMSSAGAAPKQLCDQVPYGNDGKGANTGGPFDDTCDGSPSGNGNGGDAGNKGNDSAGKDGGKAGKVGAEPGKGSAKPGKGSAKPGKGSGKAGSDSAKAGDRNDKTGNANGGKPCAGCVGNADEKNPPGQVKNENDNGYECDGNNGVGKTNPAHTGCAAPPPGDDDPPPPGDDDPPPPGDDDPPPPGDDDLPPPDDDPETPSSDPDDDTEVLGTRETRGSVAQAELRGERLSRTGTNARRLATAGFLLLAIGIAALRRSEPVTEHN